MGANGDRMHGPVANQVANGFVYELLLFDAVQSAEGRAGDADIETVPLAGDLNLRLSDMITDAIRKGRLLDRGVHGGRRGYHGGRNRALSHDAAHAPRHRVVRAGFLPASRNPSD